MDSNWEAKIVRPTTAMDERTDKELAAKKQCDQMLKLVSKGFYNELINYGVRKEEVLRVASHLLDNLLAQGKRPRPGRGVLQRNLYGGVGEDGMGGPQTTRHSTRDASPAALAGYYQGRRVVKSPGCPGKLCAGVS